MRIFSADGEFALISVGQFARGVFVIGQFAVGVFVIGQFAMGLVCVGQFVVAPAWGVAMFGLGGRGKLGVVRLLPWPKKREPVELPPTVDEEELLAGHVASGWVPARLVDGRAVSRAGRPLDGPLPHGAPANLDEVLALVERLERFDEGGGAFREAPARTVTLRLVGVRPPPARSYIPSAFSDAPIRTPEVALRVAGWLLLLVVTTIAIVEIAER